MRLICYFLLFFGTAIAPTSACAQASADKLSGQAQESKAVLEPIARLFEGMKRGDSAMVGSAFMNVATFKTVFVDSKTNQPVLRDEKLGDFLIAVASPHKEVWGEATWSPKVEIDGNFAQVWMNYAFYLDRTFNHCGVDAFHLFKDGTGKWRIFHLADTRQKTGCNVPKEVSDRFK